MAVSERHRDRVRRTWLSSKVAHRLYVSHMAACGDCLWDLCEEGKRLSQQADELEKRLPYDAHQIVREAETVAAQAVSDHEGRWPLVVALVLSAITGGALVWLPLYLGFVQPSFLAHWR